MQQVRSGSFKITVNISAYTVEASYITVHSYDILVINTLSSALPWTHVITKISYSHCVHIIIMHKH